MPVGIINFDSEIVVLNTADDVLQFIKEIESPNYPKPQRVIVVNVTSFHHASKAWIIIERVLGQYRKLNMDFIFLCRNRIPTKLKMYADVDISAKAKEGFNNVAP